MTQNDAIHSVACKTAREFMNCAQELGLTSGETLASMELVLTITIITMSIVAGNEDHKKYMVEMLDLMTENCVKNVGQVEVINLGEHHG
jgi:hypothetical protein